MIRRKNSLRKELVGMTLAALAALALSASSALAGNGGEYFPGPVNGTHHPLNGTGTDPEFGEQLIGYFTAPGGNLGTVTNITDPQEDNGNSGDSDVTCAMLYVFDSHQLLQECCGCPITSDGLRTLNNVTDLGTSAVFGPFPLTNGVIRIVDAEPNGCDSLEGGEESPLCGSGGPLVDVCDATGGVFPSGQYLAFNPAYNGQHEFVGKGDSSLDLVSNLRAWGTHIQNGALTESEFAHNPITQNDANNLAEACGDITKNGSTGVCNCGIGDSQLLFP